MKTNATKILTAMHTIVTSGNTSVIFIFIFVDRSIGTTACRDCSCQQWFKRVRFCLLFVCLFFVVFFQPRDRQRGRKREGGRREEDVLFLNSLLTIMLVTNGTLLTTIIMIIKAMCFVCLFVCVLMTIAV